MEIVVQGDNISRDVSSASIPDFTGWTGSWGVYTAIGGTALKTGILAMSTDKTRMECRIPPYDGVAVLPVGYCFLEMQVENTALGIRKTLSQEKIKIIEQGITP